MVNIKKFPKKWRHRSSLSEIEEEKKRILYIRLPYTIKDAHEISNLFFGNFIVKLPRQSSRYCHVIFSDLNEKIKNMKALKKKMINGKPIIIRPTKPINLEANNKPKQKKIVIPEPKDDSEFGKYLFVSNIPSETKITEIKNAFPGSVTVGLLEKEMHGTRQARVKIGSSELCSYYVRNESTWPILHGKKVVVTYSRKKKSKKNKQKKKLNTNDEAVTKCILNMTKDSESKGKTKNTENT